MTRLVCIVEGEGEVRAVPVAIRRIADEILGRHDVRVEPPIRVRRDRFLNRPQERRRTLYLAAAKAGNDGGIIILLDADRDCAAQVAEDVLASAATEIAHVPCRCVLAVREFESWFIAAAPSLRGLRGLNIELDVPGQPEAIQDAKGWLAIRRMPTRYLPTVDQPAFAARFDLAAAQQNAPSFDKFVRDVRTLVDVA